MVVILVVVIPVVKLVVVLVVILLWSRRHSYDSIPWIHETTTTSCCSLTAGPGLKRCRVLPAGSGRQCCSFIVGSGRQRCRVTSRHLRQATWQWSLSLLVGRSPDWNWCCVSRPSTLSIPWSGPLLAWLKPLSPALDDILVNCEYTPGKASNIAGLSGVF